MATMPKYVHKATSYIFGDGFASTKNIRAKIPNPYDRLLSARSGHSGIDDQAPL
jgi:hypothetical protein